jgi:hypothetical protein
MHRKIDVAPLLALLLMGTFAPVASSRADDGGYPHTYGGCLQAASYQLAECIDLHPYWYSLCQSTFSYLRDDPSGCHQFPMT